MEVIMVKTIEALFDGQVLLPEEPLELEPNTRVQVTIRSLKSPKKKKAVSFLEVARSLNLDTPPDFSANLDLYLNKGAVSNEE
jgi:hypothetical protein